MPFGVLASAAMLVGLAIAVPFAYAFLWPGHVRSAPFFVVTFVAAMVFGVLALYWSAMPLRDIGISGPVSSTAAGESFARLEGHLSKRFYLAAGALMLVQFAVCWATDAVLSRVAP